MLFFSNYEEQQKSVITELDASSVCDMYTFKIFSFHAVLVSSFKIWLINQKNLFCAVRSNLESCTFDPSCVHRASKLQPGESIKDFKLEFRIRGNRRSRFLCGIACDLNELRIPDLNIKDWWPVGIKTRLKSQVNPHL